jgi:hypothetical protein
MLLVHSGRIDVIDYIIPSAASVSSLYATKMNGEGHLRADRFHLKSICLGSARSRRKGDSEIPAKDE